MISYNFAYYQPTSIQEAIGQYESLKKQQKNPIYYSGGTEIITLGRVNKMVADAVIDIKKIPECQTYEKNKKQLVLGAALSLTRIRDMQLYPFMEKVISEIADHTARNKITLGGNICANIIYREAVLPLLLTDSNVVIATKDGLKEKPINKLFGQKLQLHDGEFLVQVKIDQKAIQLPYFTVKKRRQWGVGYPLITIAAVKKEGRINTAFSGLCAYPFRNQKMEEELNNKRLRVIDRIDKALQHIPGKVLNDVHGSNAYRMFVLKNILQDAIHALGRGEMSE
ncbi:FAD binding domain-containing protein [Lentibacillus sp. N15]|uniref:FAD binding domain-containing protein n=1 Tax=Lentibacillus songyuanensis TaxID=3136161 RepID=UPI0031BAC733